MVGLQEQLLIEEKIKFVKIIEIFLKKVFTIIDFKFQLINKKMTYSKTTALTNCS
jgi:hypothetical protein